MPTKRSLTYPTDHLLAVFDDAGGDEVEVVGESRPLAVVQSWVKRAQSG